MQSAQTLKPVYFYRRAGTAEFETSASEKRIIPVRRPTPFMRTGCWYDAGSCRWLPLHGEEMPETGADGCIQEFVEMPVCPYQNGLLPQAQQEPDFMGDSDELEDYTGSELTVLLRTRMALRRYFYALHHYEDEKQQPLNTVAAAVLPDEENLTLTVAVTSFKHDPAAAAGDVDKSLESAPAVPADIPQLLPAEEPELEQHTLCFDIKNGTFSTTFPLDIAEIRWSPYRASDYDACVYDGRKPDARMVYFKRLQLLYTLEACLIPRCALESAYRCFADLVRRFTGFEMAQLTYTLPADKLSTMYDLTMLPYEHQLYRLMKHEEYLERRISFKYSRNDPEIFNKFCKKIGVKIYRVLRKCYADDPLSVLVYLRLKDCGFTDINLYNRVLEDKKIKERVLDPDRKDLRYFIRYAIRTRGEAAAMNLLCKSKVHYIGDTMNMFRTYFSHVPEQLRQDLLNDGFTEFNHDALSNISHSCRHRNITFRYTRAQKRLEDTVNGYEFRLPADSDELCDIGTTLHNCVAGYDQSVKDKKCTIVYASKDGSYRLCIEVRGARINQARADHNKNPTEEETATLEAWYKRHGLSR